MGVISGAGADYPSVIFVVHVARFFLGKNKHNKKA
jgi:hypothetical protein